MAEGDDFVSGSAPPKPRANRTPEGLGFRAMSGHGPVSRRRAVLFEASDPVVQGWRGGRMKTHRSLLVSLSVAITCAVATPIATHGTGEPQRAQAQAFKGYELYTWQNSTGEWRYALVEGTNRLKSWDEVEAAAVAEAEFRRAFARLARGESVSWCERDLVRDADKPAAEGAAPRLAKPPVAKVHSILDFARRNEVNLNLCEKKAVPKGR